MVGESASSSTAVDVANAAVVGHVTDSPSGAGGVPSVGEFVKGCRIDLPDNDVVEEIEFERFFRFDRTFDMLRAGEKQDGNPVPTGLDGMQMAIYMPFVQQWQLHGYSRGRVVNSFSLGPAEEQTVEVFTWDRLRSSLENSSSFDSEQTDESSGSRRDTTDVARDLTKQAGIEVTAGGKVGFKVGIVNVDATASTDAKASLNEAEKSTRALIVDATSRSTSKVRASRTLKVTESRESGREERVTRKLRNANTCHTLTVAFFEVLANYVVTTVVRADAVRLVVLIPSSELVAVSSFDRATVRLHESALRLALLDRTLAPGFAAAHLLESRDRACAVLCHQCTCSEDSAVPPTPEWDAVTAAARGMSTAAAKVAATKVDLRVTAVKLVPPAAGMFYSEGLAEMRQYTFAKLLAAHGPRLIADVAGAGIGPAPAAVSVAQARTLAAAVAAVSMATLQLDPAVSKSVFSDLANAFMLALPALGLVDPLTGPYLASQLAAGKVSGDTSAFAQITDEGLISAISAFSAAYGAWLAVKVAERAKDAQAKEMDRIAAEERSIRILESYGLRETADAQEQLDLLLAHLNDKRNTDHYTFAVWNERAGGANDVVTLLALAGFIDPTPVGVVGDALAVEIRLDREPGWGEFFHTSMADLLERVIPDVKHHILPTAALFAEAILGECDSCEDELHKTRDLTDDQLRLANELVRLEAKRLETRLAAAPPLLDKEFPPLLAPGVACCPCEDRDHGHAHHTADDEHPPPTPVPPTVVTPTLPDEPPNGPNPPARPEHRPETHPEG